MIIHYVNIFIGQTIKEHAALTIFRAALIELYERERAINPIRTIASGILDTSGADNIWSTMLGWIVL